MTRHADLPAVSRAKLPVAYEAAKAALAKCEHLDECKTWADKAAALASYAKQAKDETMERAAQRIRARAIRRAGVLLKQIEPKPGARTDKKPRDATVPRSQAAEQAGLSERQRRTALHLANVPDDDFEEAVEAEKPATVTELARRGTATKPKPLVDLQGRDPADFRASTDAQGDLRRMAELCTRVSPAVAARGALDHERPQMSRDAKTVLSWTTDLITKLKEKR